MITLVSDMTDTTVKMKGTNNRSEVDLSSSTISSEEGAGGCSVGCFSVSTRPASANAVSYRVKGEGVGDKQVGGGGGMQRPETAKSGRHCNHSLNEGRFDHWKVRIIIITVDNVGSSSGVIYSENLRVIC